MSNIKKVEGYTERSIIERLKILYTRVEAHKAYAEILEMLEKYKERVDSQPYKLSEKDVILITYGNQVIKPLEQPLTSLSRFLHDNVKDVINSVHILPFYPYSSDDGFSVIDYKDVSPRMGSWEDIEDIGEHFRIMFDAVINHISQYSFWFKGYIRGMKEFEDFFIELDPSTDLSAVVRPRTTPLLSEFKDEDGQLHYIWTTFSKDQVDLNYANYKVLLAVLDALLFYVQKGAKLIRMDAIAFVWKEIGTNCVHLPQTHEIIQLLRDVIQEVAPEVIIITETNVPHSENVSYFGSGDNEAQMVYNFALPPLLAFSILIGDCKKLTDWAKTLSLPSDKVCFFNFTASHDGIGMRPVADILNEKETEFLVKCAEAYGGLVSYRTSREGAPKPYEINSTFMDLLTPPEAPQDLRVDRFMLAQAIMLAMPGVPGVYFHSLVGSRNYMKGVQTTGMNRSINREKLNLNLLEEELDQPGHLRQIVFHKFKRLLSIRVHEKSFDPYGKFEFLDISPHLFIVCRYSTDGEQRLLAIHNVSDARQKITIPDQYGSHFKDIVSGKKHDTKNLSLEPYQIMWLKIKEDEKKKTTEKSEKTS